MDKVTQTLGNLRNLRMYLQKMENEVGTMRVLFENTESLMYSVAEGTEVAMWHELYQDFEIAHVKDMKSILNTITATKLKVEVQIQVLSELFEQ